MAEATPTRRRQLVWALRIGILLLVCVSVRGTVLKAVGQLSQHEWHVAPAWLLVSGIFYAFGLVPMGWFWNRTLAGLGHPAPLLPTLRAYFLGHIGKYVPGKAVAVILRVAAVRRWVPSMRIALTSCLLETLTMMAVGAVLAAALSAFVLKLDWILVGVAAAMGLVAGLPTLPPIARGLARIGVMRFNQSDEQTSPIDDNLNGIDVRLLLSGWLAASVCWAMLGLSLWATLRAIGVQSLNPFSDLPVTVTAVAFSVVAGFLSFLPGGIVVREGLLVELLAKSCGDANALVATVLLRLVWLVSEVLACGILYIGAESKK